MANQKSLNKKNIIYCKYCNYDTYSKKDFNKHLLTLKHKNLINTNKLLTEIPKNPKNKINYICVCGKEYKHSSSLCKHKKICSDNIKLEIDESTSSQTISNEDVINIFLEQSKENKDLKELLMEQNKLMMEIIKKQTLTSVTNNNTTTNNNFNINLFLNEKCKDALNLMDFVNQIKGNVKDLESIGIMGFVEGISKIFIRE